MGTAEIIPGEQSLQWGLLYKGEGTNQGHEMGFLECQAEKLKLETLAM